MPISRSKVTVMIPNLTNIKMSKMLKNSSEKISKDICTKMIWIEHLIKGSTVYNLDYYKKFIRASTSSCAMNIIPTYNITELLNLFPKTIEYAGIRYKFSRAISNDGVFFCGYKNDVDKSLKYTNDKSLIYTYDDLEINALGYLLSACWESNFAEDFLLKASSKELKLTMT